MKNYKNLLLFATALLFGVFVSSCNKYEEGPKVTLLSAKNRLSQDWELTNFNKNGENQNLEGYSQFFSFSKGGSYTQTVTVQSVWGPVTEIENGSWSFSSDKKNISLTKEGVSSSNTYRLLELRKSQFKVKYTEDGDEYTRTFVSK
jgi:hypothetical protein